MRNLCQSLQLQQHQTLDCTDNWISDLKGDQIGFRYTFHIINGHRRSVNRLVCMINIMKSLFADYKQAEASLYYSKKTLSYEKSYDCMHK